MRVKAMVFLALCPLPLGGKSQHDRFPAPPIFEAKPSYLSVTLFLFTCSLPEQPLRSSLVLVALLPDNASALLLS